MQKLNRGRLLLSTCLSGVALAWAPAAQAQAQDNNHNWKPRAEVDARAADGNSQVSFELFAPVAQNESNLLFVTGRIGTDERYDRNGSVTIGGRGKIGEELAIGVNAGVDFYKTDITSRRQTAVSFGLEGFTSVFDLHMNYRLPVNSPRTMGYLDPNASPAGVLSVENSRLVERKSGWRLEEVPLAGANAEIGARVPIAKDLSVRLSGAGFDYRDEHASEGYRGVRGGLELDIENPLGSGGRFSLGAELQNDNRWGTQARGTVRLSIPLGRGWGDRSSGTSGLDRQMGDRLRRDYVTPSGTRYTDLSSTSFAIDARTGQAFGGVYYTNGAAAAAGAGTSTSPTTLSDAVTRAGNNGIVVALGNAGTIASSGVTLAANQYLLGGASSVNVRHSDGSVSAFNFGGTNGTIVGSNAGGTAITLGQGSSVRDVTVRGVGGGILANGVGGFSLERVIVENTGATGLTLTNTTGAVVVDGIAIRGGAGAGVVVNGGSNVTLRNSIIGGGAGAIDINDAGGNLTTALSNLTLSATGGTVLDIDGSGAGTVTVAGLSGIAIAGGNGEAGGFAARNVTFDSSTATGIQAVNAGTMQVGTTAARVGGAGITLLDVDGALSFANLNIANNGGSGLTVDNTKTGTFTLTTAAGTIDTTAGAALDLDPLLIDLNFSSVRSIGAAGAAIILDEVQGAGTGGNALTIGTLTISDSGQQGLYITGGSTGLVTIGGGTITNSGGASVQVGEFGVAGSGGTIGLNFSASITDAGAGPLVSLFNAGGTIRFTGAISGAGPIAIDGTTGTSSIGFAGNTAISGSASSAVSLNNVGGAVDFTGALTITNPAGSGIAIGNTLAGSSVGFTGATTIIGAASPALSLDNLAGSTAFTGTLTIADPIGTGIWIGAVPGGVTFGDVDITGLGAATGVNLTGTQGNVTFGTLDISGTGAAGSTGIDLTGATNAGAVTISNPSVIQGVDIGANLTDAAISGSFRFGDANAADGLQSRITANTVIVVAGMNATQGSYNFADVQLDGDTNNITGGSFTAYYVLAGATGAGTAQDPGSLVGAAASGAQYIVLLNDPTGGQDVLDTAVLGGSLNLIAGQSLISFLNTDFFAVTGATVPANLIVSNLAATGITNIFAGSGAAILTGSTGGATVSLANDTRIDGVEIQSAAGTGVVGAGVSNVIIRNANISGSTGAILIADNGAAASVTLSNLDLSANAGTVLALTGTGAGTLNVSGTDISINGSGTAAGAALIDVTVGTLDIDSITTGTASGAAAVQLDTIAGGTVNVGSVAVGGSAVGAGVIVANNGATVNVGAVTVSDSADVGVILQNNTGTMTLGPVSVSNSGSAGVAVENNAGAVSLGAVTVSTSVGAGVHLTGNSGDVALGALTVVNAGGSGLSVSNATGNVTVSSASISGSGSGVEITGIAGNLSVGGISVTNSGSTGIAINGVTGSAAFTGSTTIANSAGTGIVLGSGSTGTVQFGDVDITGLIAGTTGVDARAASGTNSFATLDITGASTSGTRGIDLTGATFAGSLIVSNSSTITGVGTGVDLTNAAITGSFRYGDGSNTDANGAASHITAVTPLVIAGLSGGIGNYDFADVNLHGNTTNLSVSAYFVLEGASGAGTGGDPGSLAGAEASGAAYIVLLNNPTGGNDTLDATAAGGSLDLAGGQTLLSFRDVDSFTVGGGAPANVVLFNVQTGEIVNPFTGSGAPTLTASGANATVTLGGNNIIDGVLIANSGTGAGVLGNGVAGSNIIRNSTISGGAAGAIRVFDNTADVRVALQNLLLASNGGNIMTLDGSGTGTLIVSALSNLGAVNTAETGGFAFTGVAFDSDLTASGLQDVIAGNLTLGTAVARINGTALDFSDVTGTLNFGDLNIANDGGTGLIVRNSKANGFVLGSTGGAIDTTNGTAVDVDPLTVRMTLDSIKASGGAYGIVLDQAEGYFTVTGAVDLANATNAAIEIRDNTAQADALDVQFQGAVTINNTTGAGVSLTNNAGAMVDFAGGLGITTTTGTGFSAANGGTISVTGSSNSITAGNATALSLNGVTIGANGFNFANVSVNGAATGISLTDVGTSGPAIGLGTVNLQGITSRGIDVAGTLAPGLSVTDLDIGLNSNSAVALDLNGATINSQIVIGDFDVTNTGGAGISIGVDLRGTVGGANINLGATPDASSTISGVGTGVYLNATTNALFVFGDGEAATDTGSTISATTAIDATNAPTVGNYDFRDVSFLGSPGAGFGINRIYFVDADGAIGGGNGSGLDGNNPMTLAAAELLATSQDIIVLVNNGGAISAAGSNGDDTLLLATGVQVRGFGDGVGGGAGGGSAPITLSITVPSTIQLSGGTSFNIADPTGNGAATLTSAGGANVITLGATGNRLAGFILNGNAGSVQAGVFGSGTTGASLSNLTVGGFALQGIGLFSATGATANNIVFASNLAADISSSGSGLTISNVTSTNAGGNALNFNGLSGTTTLTNVSITGASNGLAFVSTTGTVNATNVDVTNTNASAIAVTGGSASFNFDATSSVNQGSAGAAVSISSGHDTGTFTYAGTIFASNGTGLQFDNADGLYNFTGTTMLNGGDAGIDIVNGSAGTFGFGTNTTIDSVLAGDAFVLTDSNANVTYSGNITEHNGYAVRIDNHDAGTVTFQTGQISGTTITAQGLRVANSNGGTVNFNSQISLSTGANTAITLANNSGSTVAFNAVGTGLGLTTTSGTGFSIAGGGTVNVFGPNNSIVTGSGTILDISSATAAATALNLNFASAGNSSGASGILVSRTAGTLTGTVEIAGGAITATNRGIDLDGDALAFTYGGSITTSGATARSVEVTGRTANTASFTGNITDTALGINLADNSGGAISFTGATIALSTVANATALTMSSNAGASIAFGPTAGGNGLDIVALGTGTGISFTGGGTFAVLGSGNTVRTAAGQILNLVNGSVGAAGLTFDSLTSTGSVAATAINISNLDGGTLNGGNVTIAGTTGATADGIFYGGGSTANANFGAVTISNTGDEGIEINGAGNGTFSASNLAINDTTGHGVEINGSTNAVTLTGGTIGSSNDPTGSAVYVIGGTGNIAVSTNLIKTTAGNVVFVDNHETGTVNFSGNISATGGFGNGILVQNVNSGTVTFSGASKTLTTGANTAVNLNGNTGGTIAFTNGGLAITTTTGTGFSATGGGTVTVAGTGNTISSAAGVALNVANTTIGGTGLNFQSISSNGAASGIILNSTGSAGGLNVTGTGSAGSGGTIQNSTGDGISLTSTENVRLDYMNVTNNLGDGIGGANVNGFLINHMLIDLNGNDAGTDESGINIAELTGTGSSGARPTGILNSTIRNNNEFEVQISNSSGTLTNFQVINSTISSNGQPIHGNGTSPHGNLFNFLGTGTSSMGITVTGGSFIGNWNAASPPATITGSGLFIDSSGTSMTASVTGAAFTNNNNGISLSTGPGSTALTYLVTGNTFTGSRSTAINDFQNGNAPYTRTVNGTITNNTIGTIGVVGSGSLLGNGVSISNEGSVLANYLISGNTIQSIGQSGVSGSSAISVNVGLVGLSTGGGTTSLTILNNTIRDVLNSRGVVINNNQNTGALPTIRLTLSGNSFLGTIFGQAGNGQYIRLSDSGGGPFLVTQAAATASAVPNELDDANGFNDPTKVSIGTGTITFNQSAPTQPPAFTPLP